MAGIIDVPGHEDFVRTMVAGASGIDVALLVIAADEGIMPQTREHLLVLEQLRVPAGIAVLTKADAVDPDWLELVQADVAEWLAASAVPFGEPMVTSARTGAGYRRTARATGRARAHAPRSRSGRPVPAAGGSGVHGGGHGHRGDRHGDLGIDRGG